MNLDEINANLLRQGQNNDNAFDFIEGFFGNGASTVQWSSVGADGTKNVRTYPTLKQLTGDISAAVNNEMYRVVYLDETRATSGDGTQISPYNSLTAVLNDTPVAGRRSVYVVGTLNMKASAPISINNRTISLLQFDNTSKVNIALYSTTVPISVVNKGALQLMIDVNISNTYDTIIRRAFNIYNDGYLGISIKSDANVPTFTMGGNTAICWLRNKAAINIESINFIDAGKTNVNLIDIQLGELYVRPILSSIQFNSTSSVDWATLQTEIASRIGGVVKVNSVPTNVFSNVAL